MLCQNCHEKEANVQYMQSINGVKKQMSLCEECAEKLGIGTISFSMPMSLSSMLGDFLQEEETESLLSDFYHPSTLQCKQCGMTYQEFMDKGKFGCEHCYEVFHGQIDPILKHIQGANKHIGRKPTKISNTIFQKEKDKVKEEKTEKSELEILQEKLRKAIEEEKYEEAAKIRDEIKKRKE